MCRDITEMMTHKHIKQRFEWDVWVCGVFGENHEPMDPSEEIRESRMIGRKILKIVLNKKKVILRVVALRTFGILSQENKNSTGKNIP